MSAPRAREEVAKTLEFFHGQRYWLGDYVIMPNHIHCLVAFLDNDIAKTQPGSWMRFSAKKINQLLGSNGALWFPEPFDHLFGARINWSICEVILVTILRKLD